MAHAVGEVRRAAEEAQQAAEEARQVSDNGCGLGELHGALRAGPRLAVGCRTSGAPQALRAAPRALRALCARFARALRALCAQPHARSLPCVVACWQRVEARGPFCAAAGEVGC
eukprot:4501354-Prymnesium_polylepis.2